LYSLLISSLVFTACNKDDDDETPINEAQVLVEYLESSSSPYGKDYVNTDMPSIILAEAVHTDIITGADIYIIDIRSAEDFATGYIDGAVNVAAGSVLDHIQTEGLAMNDKIVIVCYTGQTAGWVTSILRLYGYTNAFSMKWGMCSWHSDFAVKWQTNISNGSAALFENDDVAKGAAGDLPTLNTGQTAGQAIFEARVSSVLAEGFGEAKVSNSEVFANLNNYYIINYWADTDYDHYGHIPGAMQYTPKQSIAYNVDLTTLPTDKTVVVYCWTGQTSAFMAAYLRVLGYNAKSLLFGANGMIYDELEGHKWSDSEIKEYDYIPGK
ncbi:MAG: rhodanese-like domain-containing protein, partial [Bacteroidales bacterium]|nr:rhodanese-like domain-containing protein [Bacteroidales bacterium]